MSAFHSRRPSPAIIVAVVALLVALGGTSYAAFSVPRNSVGTKQLKNGAVTASKIKNANAILQRLGATPVTFATEATHANNADTANHAVSADNASALGGIGSSSFAPVAYARLSSNGTVDPGVVTAVDHAT